MAVLHLVSAVQTSKQNLNLAAFLQAFVPEACYPQMSSAPSEVNGRCRVLAVLENQALHLDALLWG